jgi:1,2-dihydroxy-3-keto-5-methylthiopentene dioxygenase
MTTTVTHFNAATGSQVAHYRDPGIITTQLASLGIRFEQWETPAVLAPTAEDAAILAAYRPAIKRLQAEGGYHTVDCIHMRPDHPQKTELRAKFLNEHTHSEDEVRFFVRGDAVFYLHLGEDVYAVHCHAGDLLSVPANTPHWFDMGEQPAFTAIRFFNNTEGWVARFTGDAVAGRIVKYEELTLTE